jgi:threonine aldolase
MRRALAEAEVGDDGLEGDPTVRRLERRVAELLGKQGALFVPSGTMANQVALGALTRPGDEIVCERSAHVVQWEAGGAGANHGLQTLTLHAEDGRLDPEELERLVRPDPEHCPRTALVCVEQSFLGSGAAPGGRVLPLGWLEGLAARCAALGLAVHMDGARLWNACAASGVEPARFAASARTVSVCLSKGLGAPVGSLVAGDEDFLARARVVRKRLGGVMRQAGLLAAAGLWALEHNLERLAEDHALARRVAEVVGGRAGLEARPEEVETNVVMARHADGARGAARLCERLAEHAVLALPLGPSVRFVTHLDVGEEDVRRLERALERVPAC